MIGTYFYGGYDLYNYDKFVDNLEYGIRIVNNSTMEIVKDVKGEVSVQQLSIKGEVIPDGKYRFYPIYRSPNEEWNYIWASRNARPYMLIKIEDDVRQIVETPEPEDYDLKLIDYSYPEQADPYSDDAMRLLIKNVGKTYDCTWDIDAVFSSDKGEEFRISLNKYIRSEIPEDGELEIIWKFSNLLDNWNVTIPDELLHISLEARYVGKISEIGDIKILTKGFSSSEIECPVLRDFLEREAHTTYFNDTFLNSVTSIEIEDKEVTSINGLQKFPKLSRLELFNVALKEVTVSGFPALQILWIDGTPSLKSAVIKDNPMLHGVNFNYDCLEKLEVSNNGYDFHDNLINSFGISARENKLTKLDLRNIEVLGGIDFGKNNIEEILWPADLSKLQSIELDENNLSELLIDSSLPMLTRLNVNSNNLSTLDLSGSDKIQEIFANKNNLKEIYLPKSSDLKRVYVSENQLTELVLNDCPDLSVLHCYGNQIKELSLKGYPKMSELACYDNDLTFLNILDCKDLVSISAGSNKLTLSDFTYFDKLERLNISDNNIIFCNVQPRDYKYLSYGTEVFAHFKDGALDLEPYISQGLNPEYIRPYKNCKVEDNKLILLDTQKNPEAEYFYLPDWDASLSDEEKMNKYFASYFCVADDNYKTWCDTETIYLPNIGDTAKFKVYGLYPKLITWDADEVIDLSWGEDFGDYIPVSEWESKFIRKGAEFTVTRIGNGDIDIHISNNGVKHTVHIIQEKAGIDDSIFTEEIVPIAYYDLQGRKLDQPQSGKINIVVYSNGKSVKLYVR